jgi:hypothetical protein
VTCAGGGLRQLSSEHALAESARGDNSHHSASGSLNESGQPSTRYNCAEVRHRALQGFPSHNDSRPETLRVPAILRLPLPNEKPQLSRFSLRCHRARNEADDAAEEDDIARAKQSGYTARSWRRDDVCKPRQPGRRREGGVCEVASGY